MNPNTNNINLVENDTDKKIKLLKEIIKSSPSASKIFPDDLSIESIINPQNNVTELPAIINHDNSNYKPKVLESSVPNTSKSSNPLSSISEEIKNNLEETTNSYNTQFQEIPLPITVESIKPSEKSVKLHADVYDITNNININKSIYNKDFDLYKKLSNIYNFKDKRDVSPDIFIKQVKKKIQTKVISNNESDVYKKYISTLNINDRRLLNRFLNNLEFRFQLNNEIKNEKKTKKKTSHYKLSKKKDTTTKISTIKDIISQAPTTPTEIVVFKHIDIYIAEKLKKGDIITDKTISVCHYNPLEEYLSTTLILKINIPKRSKCLVTCPDYGFLYKDSEILLNSDSRVKIQKRRRIEVKNFKTEILEGILL